MKDSRNNKTFRVLKLYTKLLEGFFINKLEEARNHGVDERTIQRDIDDIRGYLENNVEDRGLVNSILYDRAKKGYRLESNSKRALSNSEVLAVCKILLESRAFTKKEMAEILDKLISCCAPKSSQKMISDLISNELFHYVEPRHQKVFIDTMWDIAQAIRKCYFIEIDYRRMKNQAVVKRKLMPAAIMFSEYYFYLTAFIVDEKVRQGFDVLNDSFPTIYRIDRIEKLKILDEHFHIPYSNRFEEGEFRKRIQFMYGGKLQKIKFKYSGSDINAVLDRLPTAKVLSEEDGVYTVSAEVFGKGIDMWLRSQGDNILVCRE